MKPLENKLKINLGKWLDDQLDDIKNIRTTNYKENETKKERNLAKTCGESLIPLGVVELLEEEEEYG